MTPVLINGVDKQGVAINGVQTKQALAAANETVSKGVYDATTLSAVDADLAVGNIKNAVTIFGKAGTFTGGPLVEDVTGSGVPTDLTNDGTYGEMASTSVVSGGEKTWATVTPTFAASSLAVGSGFINAGTQANSSHKARLYMGGVQVAESAYMTTVAGSENIVLVATRALSGAQEVKLGIYNYNASAMSFYTYSEAVTSLAPGGVAVGSVKI